MSLKDHPAYKEEQQRLHYTLEYLKQYYENIISRKMTIDEAVDKGKKHFNFENSQNYIDLMISSKLQDTFSQRLKSLKNTQNKPYFARVDFTEDGTKNAEKIYIGKVSLLREEDNKFLIVDWRAPVSNLYYEGRIGNSSYLCPDGLVKGKIHLKRQFTIENGKLLNLFDIDITTNDEFLQACLGANADNRLKDIVSTIQGEQNRIIRADMWKPLIVQGAAGSGKTTIALHRIAYLIYTYKKSCRPDNFMIIAPNRFFLNYISEVLPELDVENVRQTTFEDFACEIIGKKYKITDSNQKLADFINSSNLSSKKNTMIKKISHFKSSLIFKDIIEQYMSDIEKEFLPHNDFKIEGITVYAYEDIQNLFLNEYNNLPFMKRINEIKKHLVTALKRSRKKILLSIELKYDKKLRDIKSSMDDCPERRKIITELFDERDKMIGKIEKSSKTLLKEYVDEIKPLSPLEYYKNLINDKNKFYSSLLKYLSQEEANFMINYSNKLFKDKYVENEDLAPIMYIKYIVYGLSEKIEIKQTVIDEAQDFSLFQLYTLKHILKNSSFTILGDLCQGIHSYRSLTSWNDVYKYIFSSENCTLLTLEQSYRTTVEIMEAANSVIAFLKDKNLPPAKPVIRHGESVKVCIKQSANEIACSIKEDLIKIHDGGFKSCAIICKTSDECIKLNTLLKKMDVHASLLNGKEKVYTGGTVIIPSYLVKGLEFDAVIIADASYKIFTEDELDIKLLYVEMTRPLHRLYIYSCGKPASVLKNIKIS